MPSSSALVEIPEAAFGADARTGESNSWPYGGSIALPPDGPDLAAARQP